MEEDELWVTAARLVDWAAACGAEAAGYSVATVRLQTIFGRTSTDHNLVSRDGELRSMARAGNLLALTAIAVNGEGRFGNYLVSNGAT